MKNGEQLNNKIDDRLQNRTRAERVQRFIDYMDASDKDKVGLEGMDSETALKTLQYINSQLRNDKVSAKSEIYGDKTHRMRVSAELIGGEQELVAPEPELQKELFQEYFDAIKKIDDKDKKALLAYYAINNLHLFSDGNGRTSRTVYYLLKNGSLSDVNDKIAHNHNLPFKLGEMNDYDDGSGRKDFLSENKIKPAEQINRYANAFLQEQMVDEGLLDDNFKDKSIYAFSVRQKGSLVAVMMSKKNRQGLSDEDSQCLNYAMSDGVGGGSISTLAGLTLATVIQQKGLSKKIVDNFSLDDGRLPIRVNFDDDDSPDRKEMVKESFEEWTSDDYKKTIEVYRELKKKQNEMIIKFFTEDIKFDDGVSVADWAMGRVD